MDTLNGYRDIIEKIVREYARYQPANGEIASEAIIDRNLDHYEIMRTGWEGKRRIHGAVLHVDIIQGKIWIQFDGTTLPFATALVEAGVPKSDIVIGYHSKNLRHLTGFAVA